MLLHIPANGRIVVPEVVVVGPGFPVTQLPRGSRVVDEDAYARGILVRQRRPEGIGAVPAPGDLVVGGPRDHPRGVRLVRVDVVDTGSRRAPRRRHAVQCGSTPLPMRKGCARLAYFSTCFVPTTNFPIANRANAATMERVIGMMM